MNEMGLHLIMIGASVLVFTFFKLAERFHLWDFLEKKFSLDEEEEMIMWHAERCLLGDHVAVRENRDTHKIECYDTRTGKTVKIEDIRTRKRKRR